MDETGTSHSRRAIRGLILAVLMLAVSSAAFAGAIVYFGGVDEVMRMVGLQEEPAAPEPSPLRPDAEDPEVPQPPAQGIPTTPTAEITPTPEPPGDLPATAQLPSGQANAPVEAAAAPSFPVSAAQAAMYREQLQSQSQIAKLANNEIGSLSLGTAAVGANRADIPATVTYRGGGSLSGTMALARTDGLWYFLSITAYGGTAMPQRPRTVDSGVVRTIVTQQATAENQRLMDQGLIKGGFKRARVDGVTKGSGTATVHVTLLGGTLDRKAARFVLVSKDEAGRKYWFITRFELK